MKMSIIDKYPTQAQLSMFYTLCAEVELEFRGPRVRFHGHRNVGCNKVLTKMKFFLLKLRVTNFTSMLAYVNKHNQYALIQLLSDMLPITEIFPTDSENHMFDTLCEARQECIRPRDFSTNMRRRHVHDMMDTFITNLRATNLLCMTSRAVKLNQFTTVLILAHHTGNVHQRDVDGNTVLHLIAKLSTSRKLNGWYFSILDHLLKKRCDLDAINSENKSALDIAAELGCVNMVEELLKFGANIFGNQDSAPTLDFIHTVMLNRPVDEKTPLLEEIECTVKSVDNSVRGRVDEIEALVIQERNLAFMMSTHKRLGKQSRLNHLDENMVRSMVLEEINRVYTADYLRNLSTDVRREMIIDAYDIHETSNENVE